MEIVAAVDDVIFITLSVVNSDFALAVVSVVVVMFVGIDVVVVKFDVVVGSEVTLASSDTVDIISVACIVATDSVAEIAGFVTCDTVVLEIDIVSLIGVLNVVEVPFLVVAVVPTLVVTLNSIGVYLSSGVDIFLAVTSIAVLVTSVAVMFSDSPVVVVVAGGSDAVVRFVVAVTSDGVTTVSVVEAVLCSCL